MNLSGKGTWGIVPAAGAGSRIQPLAFSKELLPVGSRIDEGMEKPKAVSEYIIERMILGGADKICFVISPGKSDILEYYSAYSTSVHFSYVVQAMPAGLCDAVFRPAPLIGPCEQVIIGLPDTIWQPPTALRELPDGELALLLFPVVNPSSFDAVVTDASGRVLEIQVKSPIPQTHWIWGAIKMPGELYHTLHVLWLDPFRRDEYIGTLINAYLRAGGSARAFRAGTSYMDVGTIEGYRTAQQSVHDEPAGSGLMNAGEP